MEALRAPTKCATAALADRLPASARAGQFPRPIAFSLVGGWNTAFGLTVYTVSASRWGLHLPYLTSLLVGHVMSVVVAFVLYRRLVFRVRGTPARDFARFELVNLANLALNAGLLFLSVRDLKANRVGAEFLVTVLLVAGSYFAHRDFSFRRRAHRVKLRGET
ncbi:MAG: GtrA family protein [Mycobacteriales bacterium]